MSILNKNENIVQILIFYKINKVVSYRYRLA